MKQAVPHPGRLQMEGSLGAGGKPAPRSGRRWETRATVYLTPLSKDYAHIGIAQSTLLPCPSSVSKLFILLRVLPKALTSTKLSQSKHLGTFFVPIPHI